MSARDVLVVGMGVTGRAVVGRLSAEGRHAVVVDDAPTPEAEAAARDAGVRLFVTPSGEALAELVASVDSVVVSPGVAPSHAVVQVAERLGVPVTGEVELASGVLAERGAAAPTLVAITGTNGKTTVTTLVAACLAASGRQAVAAGNIGRPLVEVVADPEWQVVVAEVSSFQLQLTSSLRPKVSCWLNFAPDHLDWHPTMEHYAAAKARIWARQGPGDSAVVNADDAAVMAAAAHIPAGARVLT
ncbi:MAG: UDP-N-acetylmuramoyl-L-alanine--D-glutamate ligase, partial [Acidimicrobiales bacterium]